jgi:hypothetical protein
MAAVTSGEEGVSWTLNILRPLSRKWTSLGKRDRYWIPSSMSIYPKTTPGGVRACRARSPGLLALMSAGGRVLLF